MNIVQNTIYCSIKKSILNILIIPFAGKFEFQLADLGHNLFIIGEEWEINKSCEIDKKPPNITFFPVQKEQQLKIPNYISFDLIICNRRINYHLAKQLQLIYQTPIILVEHDIPDLQNWQKKQINNELLINKPSAIISLNNTIFNHWGEIGGVFTKKEEWQSLFYQLTKGGYII